MPMFLRTAGAAALIASVAACSGDISGGDLVSAGRPTGWIEVVNAGVTPIDTILLSECSTFTYGFDRLPDGVVLYPGDSYTFSVNSGCWDVAAGLTGVDDGRLRTEVRAGGTTVVNAA